MAHTSHPNTQEAETGALPWVASQPGLHIKTCLKSENENKETKQQQKLKTTQNRNTIRPRPPANQPKHTLAPSVSSLYPHPGNAFGWVFSLSLIPRALFWLQNRYKTFTFLQHDRDRAYVVKAGWGEGHGVCSHSLLTGWNSTVPHLPEIDKQKNPSRGGGRRGEGVCEINPCLL